MFRSLLQVFVLQKHQTLRSFENKVQTDETGCHVTLKMSKQRRPRMKAESPGCLPQAEEM